MTYAQRQQSVKRALRQARRSERSLDTAVEVVERELFRLLKRKTLIEPRSLGTLVKSWDAVKNRVGNTDQAMIDVLAWSASV